MCFIRRFGWIQTLFKREGSSMGREAIRSVTKKLSFTAILIALGVILSPIYIPLAPYKLYPMAHTINVLGGIFLGPLYATVVATAVGVIRIGLGTGTVFAIPGGVPGAIVIGLVYKYLWRSDWASFSEVIGSPIGAAMAVYIVGPMAGRHPVLLATIASWTASGIIGSLIGFLVVKALRRLDIL